MRYPYLIIDADHTLINYTQDERNCLRKLYLEYGISLTEEELNYLNRISEKCWANAGLYNVADTYIQKEYHNLYRTHVSDIFETAYKEKPYLAVEDISVMGKKFLKGLEVPAILMPYAEEILSYLKNKGYKIYVATNGISDMQYGRLKNLDKYIDGYFVSEEMGAIKPQKEFYEKILSTLNVNADSCLMIGDSMSSDVLGAKTVGIHGLWYNSRNEKKIIEPEYEVENLKEIENIL